MVNISALFDSGSCQHVAANGEPCFQGALADAVNTVKVVPTTFGLACSSGARASSRVVPGRHFLDQSVHTIFCRRSACNALTGELETGRACGGWAGRLCCDGGGSRGSNDECYRGDAGSGSFTTTAAKNMNTNAKDTTTKNTNINTFTANANSFGFFHPGRRDIAVGTRGSRASGTRCSRLSGGYVSACCCGRRGCCLGASRGSSGC